MPSSTTGSPNCSWPQLESSQYYSSFCYEHDDDMKCSLLSISACLRQEQQGYQLSDAWKVDVAIHVIRRLDYRGKSTAVSLDRPRLSFDALTTPGLLFAATCFFKFCLAASCIFSDIKTTKAGCRLVADYRCEAASRNSSLQRCRPLKSLWKLHSRQTWTWTSYPVLLKAFAWNRGSQTKECSGRGVGEGTAGGGMYCRF